MVPINMKEPAPAAAKLRRHAEKQLSATKKNEPQASQSAKERQSLVHELKVHQLELEMQNAELRRALDELELSHNKFTELYNLAPVAYFSFDSHGRIREVNLAGAQLLRKKKGMLINNPFVHFIADQEGEEIFSHHLESVSQRQGLQRCEISLKGKGDTKIYGQLQSVAVDSTANEDGYILTSIVDGTARKQVEVELQIAHNTLELIINKRTGELTQTNTKLLQEIAERKETEKALNDAYTEIEHLRDRLQAENVYLKQEVSQKYKPGDIVGQNSGLSSVFLRAQQVAPQNATVLILGETGTGKGVIARAIHSMSARNDRAMIPVNCTALPGNLIESELFGREKGAFTGANARQIGRFELADGGTIFLDEIGEMPLELQSKLLRIIQEGEFERLGSPRTIKIDLRIIAASNRNLDDEVKNGRFRADLFYRLNVFPITIPPLRQRKDDIPLFVNHFVAKFNKKIGKKITTVSIDTLNALQEYDWPGNVRELESVIERAVITSQGTSLHVLDRFDTFIQAENLDGQDIKALAEIEHDHILQVLKKTDWRIEGKNGAAILLGLNPSTLRARMRKYHIVRQ